MSFVREEVVARLDSSLVIIGSSFGAFVATHVLAELSEDQRSRISKLVLIAPVFDPWDERGGLLTGERERIWRERGVFPLLDLERGMDVPVHYRFVEELRTLSAQSIAYRVPTLIVHGLRDEVVPCAQSEEFARNRPWVRLERFNDDHQLLGDPEALLKVVEGFILSKSAESR
jgi:pimeloyl-ACP methyl ester carboxylesterase